MKSGHARPSPASQATMPSSASFGPEPSTATSQASGLGILQAESIECAAAALVAALDHTGLFGTAVAWTGPQDLVFHPASARTPAREAWLTAALTGSAPSGTGTAPCRLCDDTGNATAFLIGPTDAGLPGLTPAQRQLHELAGRRLRELFGFQRLSASVQGLAQAEKMQRALFAIADLAGSDRDMPSMLQGLHAIIGQLMYAENFYIALHEAERSSLRFLYFADTVEEEAPPSDQEVPLAALDRGLTWYLIHDGRPLMGGIERLREQVSGPLNARGADCYDWLGVPMLRDGRSVGALVVQSYLPGIAYTEADRAVLTFVAEHVLTAVERKQGQARLEQRVVERTRQLAEANRVLQQQIQERERAEHLQATLYRIAALTNNEESNERFYQHIHMAVAELINAENFYIALLSEDRAQLDFPYSVDARNGVPSSRPLGHGLSEYVIRQGKALLADTTTVQRLVDTGEVASAPALGVPAHCWLGVPLLGSEGVIGVVAVQSYRSDLDYNDSDAELLTFVSYQIANSLQRRHHAETLRRLNAELEQRVQTRTHELREQISVREQVEARLKHEVMHDPLTGLPNRLYLRDRLERAIAGHRRNGKRRFALMYLDVDRFKLFNDSLGHLAGDEVLREVARRLGECVREPDVVARLSGDEFAVLLEDSPIPQTACKVAQRIQACLQRPMLIAGRELQASASIGIAVGELRHQTADDVLHDADIALYRAKAAGRQRFVLFDDSLQQNAMDVLDIEQQLRVALLNGEFEPHFQPIVRLSDGVAVGHEALVRWRHPQRGLLGPADFLAVAEDSGLIEAIDWQVYRAVCQAGAGLVRDGGYLTINLCTRHFKNEDFDERLLALTAETGFDPARLRIEVTEGTLLGDSDVVVRILGRLRAAGVEAALDDFGTGYSSLGYLHRFPLKMIKIDRSFISPLGDAVAGRSSAIVSAILALAQSLELEVVAEGVESEVQRDALRAMGCTYAQGYFYGRPKAA